MVRIISFILESYLLASIFVCLHFSFLFCIFLLSLPFAAGSWLHLQGRNGPKAACCAACWGVDLKPWLFWRAMVMERHTHVGAGTMGTQFFAWSDVAVVFVESELYTSLF
jgi:hypothetical protein